MTALVILALVLLVVWAAAGVWCAIDHVMAHEPTDDTTEPETDGGWVPIGGWIEDADGTRHPATPDARAAFMKRWDAEVLAAQEEQ